MKQAALLLLISMLCSACAGVEPVHLEVTTSVDRCPRRDERSLQDLHLGPFDESRHMGSSGNVETNLKAWATANDYVRDLNSSLDCYEAQGNGGGK